jgi:hypothetical protein
VISIHNPGATCGDSADLLQNLRVSAKFLTNGKTFGNANHSDAKNKVVNKLSDLASAGLAAMEEVCSHSLEAVFSMLELFWLTADHKSERATMGTCNTTTHRAIQKGHVVFEGLGMEVG